MMNGRTAAAMFAAVAAVTLASAGPTPAASQEPGEIRADLMADVVYTNGTVVTLDSASTVASSVAIKDDEIVGVGDWSRADLQPFVGPDTRIYDLEGRTVIPGLQDSHLHFIDLGGDIYYVARFDDATSVAQVQRILEDHLAKLRADDELDVWSYPETGEIGPWIFGAGWNQSKIAEGRMATRQELDEVSREVPITLDRVYRGIAVNTKVFELMGYDFDRPESWPDWFTEDPDRFGPGDVIARDPETGLPTGVFYGSAAGLVRGVPSRTFEQDVESVARGAREVLTKGVVSVVDPSVQAGNRVYQEAYNRGLLPIRVTTYDGIWTTQSPERMADRFETYGLNNLGDLNFKIRGIKLYGDGGAGSRSAAVSVAFEPIPTDPMGDRNFGELVEPDFDARLAQFRTAAVDFGWELHTHSIGDVTMRQTTDGYKIVMDEIRARDPDADLRYSIIHAYMPDEPGTSVIRDMADYGIIASINPGDIHVEGDSFLENLGAERMARLLPFRTYLDNGVVMASGSDYSVAPWDPWIGIYAMRTRRLQVSGEVMGPEQTIPLEDALESYTINGAYLNYEDDVRGSIERGKLADLVVIDADLLNVRDEDLRSMGDNVVITMVGGRVEYRRDGFELPEVGRER